MKLCECFDYFLTAISKYMDDRNTNFLCNQITVRKYKIIQGTIDTYQII